MSFDLFLWDPAAPCSDDDVRERYARAAEGEDDDADEASGESARVDGFFNELTRTYPRLDELPEEQVDASPWSCGPDRGDRWIMACIRWSAAQDVLAQLERLASRHGLVLYDPQGDQVHRPKASAS